jgi:hypothetical protein
MTDYYTNFVTSLKLNNPDQVSEFIIAWEAIEDASFIVHRDHTDPRSVIIRDFDEALDREDLPIFILAQGAKFGLTGRKAITFAYTCSKPRLDSFSGALLIIDFDSQEYYTIDIGENGRLINDNQSPNNNDISIRYTAHDNQGNNIGNHESIIELGRDNQREVFGHDT